MTLHVGTFNSSTEKPNATSKSSASAAGVHFEESVYELDESEALESRVTSGFAYDFHCTHFVSETKTFTATYDCSHR